MNRRDLIVGGACLAALGAAEALRPRTIMTLRGREKIADLLPRDMPGWSSTEGGGGDIVVPRTPDSLSSRLYTDLVARIYSPSDGSVEPPIMLLVAYGENQSDMLQLHRPESCYPAVGFRVVHRHLSNIPVGRRAMIPGVELTAVSGDRTEDIVYWTRMGEYLPQTSGEQRRDRLLMSLNGIIGDGVLVRCSAVRTGTEPNFKSIHAFIARLAQNIRPVERKVLLGSRIDRQLGATLNVAL